MSVPRLVIRIALLGKRGHTDASVPIRVDIRVDIGIPKLEQPKDRATQFGNMDGAGESSRRITHPSPPHVVGLS